MEVDRITRSEIKEAIHSSGYLIEQRVLGILSEDYFVAPNYSFLDPISGKTREIDLKSDSTTMWAEDFPSGGIHCTILCECENNVQPVVFFPFNPLSPSDASALIKCYGIPMKIYKENEYVDLLSFLPFHKFHHYCRGAVATQYCSFTKPKGGRKWIATHIEEQHDTLTKLVYATEYEINQFYSEAWEPPKADEPEPILVVLVYPLLILGGELMEAHLGQRGLITNKVNHVQFLSKLYIAGSEVDYKIDVIREDYLPEYMEMINHEMNKLHKLVTRHKKVITQSVERIVKDVKDAKATGSYKSLLTIEA
jgi:hypothetical protein